MDTVTYPHPTVAAILKDWIFTRCDASVLQEDAKRLAVSAVPVAIVVAPDGTILGRRGGFVEPQEFARWLRSLTLHPEG